MVADVKVLLVRVSIVSRPINVSVVVGRVSKPVLLIELIIGVVRVLLINVSTLSVVAIAPDEAGRYKTAPLER